MLRTLVALLLAAALAGCAGLSVGPGGGVHPTPVTVSVDAGADIEIGSLRALVDGVDRTSEFQYASPGTQRLYARLNLGPGMHTVQATANVWNGYDRRYYPRSAQATFEAAPGGSLAVSISPTAVAVLPGGAATIGLQITRTGSFTGEVSVGESNPGYGTGNTTTISIFDTTGTIPVAARSDAWAAEVTRTITATGTLFSTFVRDDKPLTFRIGHRAGPFTRATYSARSAGQSATQNQVALNVENGPPGGARFEARFRHPSGYPSVVVGFEPGVPLVGGAGFCSTDAVGFVMSGGAANGDHALTLVLFEDVFSRVALAIPASVPNGAVVVPEVFFARDCAVVIMVGADTQTQRAFRAQVYDVHRRRTLCGFAFDAAASTLQAELPAPVGDNQTLRVTIGGQTISCPLF